jgi:hypothetical protein
MFEQYCLIYRKTLAAQTVSGVDTRYLDPKWTKTDITFKGRNHDEALKKAKRFWSRGQFGMGAIDVKLC